MYGPDQKIIILVNSGQYFGKQLKQIDFAGVNNVTIKEKKTIHCINQHLFWRNVIFLTQ